MKFPSHYPCIFADNGCRQQSKVRRSDLAERALAGFSYIECGSLARGEWVLLTPSDINSAVS